MSANTFEPFSDRLSRDIRNDLSKTFIHALAEHSISPALAAAEEYLKHDPALCYREYITIRLERYREVLASLVEKDEQDVLLLSFILWDAKLFFEVHELLEPLWLKSHGEEKLFLQAMIRAAGVFIKLEYGYRGPAASIAAKAIPVLRANKNRLAQYINPETLIQALFDPDGKPPKLLTE